MMIRKTIALACLLLACSMGYADSLERFVNRYKEKEGAVCRVFNKDRHFNDVPEEDVSPEAQRLVSGMLAVMGVEEWMSLKLERCAQPTRERFADNVLDAIPADYALLKEGDHRHIYVNNADEEFAYVVLVNCDEAAPSLTRLYVTNAFMRAVMNDEGTGIDEEKFTRYLEGVVEGLEESMRGLGKSIEGGVRRLEKRLEEWARDMENRHDGVYDM